MSRAQRAMNVGENFRLKASQLADAVKDLTQIISIVDANDNKSSYTKMDAANNYRLEDHHRTYLVAAADCNNALTHLMDEMRELTTVLDEELNANLAQQQPQKVSATFPQD